MRLAVTSALVGLSFSVFSHASWNAPDFSLCLDERIASSDEAKANCLADKFVSRIVSTYMNDFTAGNNESTPRKEQDEWLFVPTTQVADTTYDNRPFNRLSDSYRRECRGWYDRDVLGLPGYNPPNTDPFDLGNTLEATRPNVPDRFINRFLPIVTDRELWYPEFADENANVLKYSCADRKRRSIIDVPIQVAQYYFPEAQVGDGHLYLANISHLAFDQNDLPVVIDGKVQEDFYIAKVPVEALRTVIVQEAVFKLMDQQFIEFLDQEFQPTKKALGAAHFQIRLNFYENAIELKLQDLAKFHENEDRSFFISDLVHSIEGSGMPPFKYNLFDGFKGVGSNNDEIDDFFTIPGEFTLGSLMGLWSEIAHDDYDDARFMNTFRMKSLDSAAFDSLLSKSVEERRKFGLKQYTLDLSNAPAAPITIIEEMAIQATHKGMHTPYNTFVRNCSVLGFEALDIGLKKAGYYNSSVDYNNAADYEVIRKDLYNMFPWFLVDSMVEVRGLVSPDRDITAPFENNGKVYEHLMIDELCQDQKMASRWNHLAQITGNEAFCR